jgi:two-component system, LytTR family, sensor kinase
MFTTKYRYLFIAVLGVYSYFNSLFSEVYTYYHIRANWYDILAVFLLITLFVWEGNRFLQKILNLFPLTQSPIRFFAIFFLLGLILSSLISFIIVEEINRLFMHLPIGELKMPIKLAFTYGTRINLFLHILNAVLFYIGQYKNKQLEAEELKRINSQAQLQAIKNQVNPHFLFNNLNVLSTLVMQESPEANKFIEEFSKVYRHVLSSSDQELITLQSELEFINPYIFLLQKRFPESIFVTINISPQYLSYKIIPVAVQMLLENAIKHNIASRQKPLDIYLSVNENKYLTVMNNLQTRVVEESSTQIGLENISKRYELITGKTIEIEKTNTHFIVSLPLIKA